MRRRAALAALLVLAAAVVAWRLTRPPPPTDEDQIRSLFAEAVRAAEERRVADAVAGFSERFQGQGLDRRGVKQLVAANALRGNWLVVRIAGLRVEVAGDGARAVLDLVATRAGAGKALVDLLPSEGNAWRVEARLEREPEGWRITGASWAEETLVEALSGPEGAPEGAGAGGAGREPAPAR